MTEMILNILVYPITSFSIPIHFLHSYREGSNPPIPQIIQYIENLCETD
ncbi:hypothetical protein ACUXCC_000360 [Cytobacillus horneckiae]